MKKYQDNYALCCFLRRAFPEEDVPAALEAKENSSSNAQRAARPRFKVVAPEKLVPPALKKEEQPMVSNEELQELHSSSHRKLRDI